MVVKEVVLRDPQDVGEVVKVTVSAQEVQILKDVAWLETLVVVVIGLSSRVNEIEMNAECH